MATNVSLATIADSGFTAAIQSWSQFVEDTLLIAGGWNLTNDAGQTAPANLPVATASLQKKGYRIYTMSDNLQGQYPVFLRIDYGSGNVGTGNPTGGIPPGVWLTIGTGSDGNGNIRGAMLNSQQVGSFNGGVATVKSYASAGPGRCTIGLFASGASGNYPYPIVFGIERWKDATGADIGGGLLVVYSSAANVQGNVQICLVYSPCLAFGAPVQQPIDVGLNYVHTTNDPSPTLFGDRGLGVLFHFRGSVVQPGTNFLICNQTDMAVENYVYVNIYGAQHPYLSLGASIIPFLGAIAAVGFGPTAAGDLYRRILMRFD